MKVVAGITTAVFVLASCGGGKESTPRETLVTSETTAVVADQTVSISLEVGTSTGPEVTHVVAVGSTVRIMVTNPSEDDEFHLHGYDLSAGEVPAGETATIEFVADVTGSFELESHHSGSLLMTLVVE